ncbi:MAG: TolC family protein, partial [Prochlorococcaceae cyanobacterium ETNP1_MAG_9]|nr:TolC family protein [Prochlorococcaceae cyanobacterium ETNP1_MAG_9]
MKSPWLLKPSKKKEQAFQIAKDNSKAGQFPSKAKNLQSKVSEFKGPDHLSLPSKASEIRVKDQYKVAITDLERLIEENSPKLEIYRRQVKQEKYNLRKTVSSWYPTLDLSASPQYLDANNYYYSRTNTSSDRWQTTLSAEINWNLVDPRRSPEIAAAKDKYEQARTKYLIQARDIKVDALNTYFTLQNSDEGVRI